MLTEFSRRADDAPLLRENLRMMREAYHEKQREYLRALGKRRRGEHNGVVRNMRMKLRELQIALDTIRASV